MRTWLAPVICSLSLLGLAPAMAQTPSLKSICKTCGIVKTVASEKREGEGGAAGIVGGAVVGGLLGNQVGGGTGKTLATLGGAVGGAYLGNEVQKKVTSKTVWVSTVQMKDGGMRRFEQAEAPGWKAGQVVRVTDQGALVPQK